MKVHKSGLKHGISVEDADHAATWSLWIEDLDDDSPARQLRLGFDTRGRMLETVVLLSSEQELPADPLNTLASNFSPTAGLESSLP